MDSINRNQPEDNYDDLNGEHAIEKMKDLCEKSKTCFFCTFHPNRTLESSRPMTVLQVDDQGILWFLSAEDSNKNQQLAIHSQVMLFFQGSPYSDFMTLEGEAQVNKNKEKIKELWGPLLKTWFTEGINDPRITVISFRVSDGYYWDTKHGKLVAFLKQTVGAILGKTLDDSIEGKIDTLE